MRTGVHLIEVIVNEDGREVSRFGVTYFAGQDYSVLIETPNGVDMETDTLTVGAPQLNK